MECTLNLGCLCIFITIILKEALFITTFVVLNYYFSGWTMRLTGLNPLK